MVRVAVAALLLGACFSKPAFHGGDDGSGSDAGADARRDAPPGGYMDAPDAPPGCTTIISEPFTTMPADPCMPWGAKIVGMAAITRSAGTLHMTGPTPSTGGFSGGCQSTAFDASKATVMVHLIQAPIAGAFWSTSLELTRTAAAETTAIRVYYSPNPMMMGTFITMTTHGGAQLGTFAYAPAAVQYLRFTATTTSNLHGEYSLNGSSWTAFGDDLYAQSIGTVTLAMKVSAMGNDGQQAIWDDLSVVTCP